MSRDTLLQHWVAQQFPGQNIELAPASADASFRRYFRVTLPDGSSRIVMDAPPEREDCRPFIQVAGLMAEAGVHVPAVLAQDLDQGFLLLTDLGNSGYLARLQTAPAAARALFASSGEALMKWQQASRPDVLPPYDAALLRRELDLFPEWFLGRHLQFELTDADKAMLEQVFETLIAAALNQPQVYVHRDFMPRNLMLCSEGTGVLDFQDAVYGPLTYDLVSLYRDAFISWEEEDELDWVIRYWEKARKAGLPVRRDFSEFWQEYEWMGLQRHFKVLGIFCRLNYRDGKSNYMADLPRFLRYVRHVAERYIVFKPLIDLLDRIEGRSQESGYTF
ncbi:MAG: hypothetical protein RIR00_1096 [Pseudomonadota bacterium]|jgi:aminoglycoside/choline kinase family phosphotransferase